MTLNITVRVDVSSTSAVGICGACGQRWIAEDRAGARTEARRHEMRCHPGSVSQLNALHAAAARSRRAARF